MRTVESVLRELDDALDLPARRKLILLREIRADFEGVVSTLTAGGCSSQEAHARALRLLSPTAEDARSLAGIHRTPYARLTGVLPPRPVRLMEWGSVVGMAAVGGVTPVFVLTRASDLPLWAALPFGCVSLLVLTNLAWHVFRLFVRQDLDAAALARASVTQAGLIALALTSGLTIVALQAYLLFGGWAAGDAPDVAHVARAALIVAQTAAVVLTIAVLGFVGGVVLLQCFLPTRDDERELQDLFGEPDSREEFDAE